MDKRKIKEKKRRRRMSSMDRIRLDKRINTRSGGVDIRVRGGIRSNLGEPGLFVESFAFAGLARERCEGVDEVDDKRMVRVKLSSFTEDASTGLNDIRFRGSHNKGIEGRDIEAFVSETIGSEDGITRFVCFKFRLFHTAEIETTGGCRGEFLNMLKKDIAMKSSFTKNDKFATKR